MSKPDDFKFDSRVRDRLLRSRTLSVAEVKQHLEQLPDLEGEYEVLNDTPQPAVTPAREQEEPLVFDGIRRLQALSDPHSSMRSSSSMGASSSALPLREPPPRAFGGSMDSSRGPALRSALMESEISGVGAGAVSAALGAMAAEARSAAAANFPPVVPMNQTALAEEPQTPVTLRSQAAPEGLLEDDEDDEDDDDDDLEAEGEAEAASTPAAAAPPPPPPPAEEKKVGVADWEAPYPDSEDMK